MAQKPLAMMDFTEENGYGNLSAGARFILVHLAASYANGSSDAFFWCKHYCTESCEKTL